jgi:hypothetical protein
MIVRDVSKGTFALLNNTNQMSCDHFARFSSPQRHIHHVFLPAGRRPDNVKRIARCIGSSEDLQINSHRAGRLIADQRSRNTRGGLDSYDPSRSAMPFLPFGVKALRCTEWSPLRGHKIVAESRRPE